MAPRVKHVRERREPGDVYIGRPSKWGNPFVVGTAYLRGEACHEHALWIRNQPQLMAQLPELKGKNLVCYCAPKACHGDTLLALANQEATS